MNLFSGTEQKQMELRDYQSEACAAVAEKFKEFQKLLMVIPTGGGKTIVFSRLAQMVMNKELTSWEKDKQHAFKVQRFKSNKTLILAHRDELVNQAIDKLWQSTGIVAEKEKAEDYADQGAPVVVGSVQTMARAARLDRWPRNHFGLVVVDEAHHALADSYQRILDYFDKDACVLGVTATPDRGDKRNLGKYFQDLAYEISLLELINRGFLSRIKLKTIPIRIDLSGVKIENGDYDVNDLDTHISKYLNEIAATIREQAPFRKVLIFLPLVRTSLAMRDACRKAGLAAEHIDGSSTDRAELLEKFSKNKFDVLCNAMLLTEGFDCIDIDCVVVLRPTKVPSLYAQMVGRGTRIATGKDYLLLLDFLWMHEKHGEKLVKPASLISSGKVSAAMQDIAEKGGMFDIEELHNRAIGEIEERVEAETDAKRQREAKLVESIKENATKHKRFMDAMEFAVSLHDEEMLDYEPEFAWENEQPTERQLQALANMGIDPATIASKGLASKLLDRAFTRRNLKLATPKQLAILRKFKHPQAELVTFTEASQLIDGYFGQSKSRPMFQRIV